MRKARKMSLIGVLLVLALIVSACGNGMGNMDMGNNKNMDMGNKDMGNMDMGNSSGSADPVSVVASNWKWELSKTEFKVGETVTFSIESKEGVHGFAINGTDINETIAPGETKTVTWTPDKAGEYTLACSVACGTGHNDMVQKIMVTQ